MATLTATAISRTGATITGAAASGGGDKFGSTGKEFLYVKNADSGSHNVIIAVQGTVDGQAATSRTITVGAGVEMLIGPFQPSLYNAASDGLVAVTYSAVTSVTVALFSLTGLSAQS